MMKEFRNPKNVHSPIAGYVHQVEVKGSSRLLILSGQVGRTLRGEVSSDPIEQLSVAFDNIIENLTEADMNIKDLVKLTMYIVGEMDAPKRAAVIGEKLKGHRPCMTLVFVAALASPVYKVEIDAWANAE